MPLYEPTDWNNVHTPKFMIIDSALVAADVAIWYPVDAIKVRQGTAFLSTAATRSYLTLQTRMQASTGVGLDVRGLWRGAGVAALSAVPTGVAYLVLYNTARVRIETTCTRSNLVGLHA